MLQTFLFANQIPWKLWKDYQPKNDQFRQSQRLNNPNNFVFAENNHVVMQFVKLQALFGMQ